MQRSKAANNLLFEFDMHEFGMEMMRQTLKRNNPKDTEEELRLKFLKWLNRVPQGQNIRVRYHDRDLVKYIKKNHNRSEK